MTPLTTFAQEVAAGAYKPEELRERALAALEGNAAQEDAEDVLRRNGFVRCDIAACNCGSWHARYGLPERMAELKELLADAGHPLCNDNGHLIGRALQGLIDERDRLALEGADAVQGWISVEDRLPEKGVNVLTYRPMAHETNDPHLAIDSYMGAINHKSYQGVEHGFGRWCHPTHWMPLPKAPPPPVLPDRETP